MALDYDTLPDGMGISITGTFQYPYATPPLDNTCDLQKGANSFYWKSKAVSGTGNYWTTWMLDSLKLIYDSTAGVFKWKLYLYSTARPNPFASGVFTKFQFWTGYKAFTTSDPSPVGTYSNLVCNSPYYRVVIDSATITAT